MDFNYIPLHEYQVRNTVNKHVTRRVPFRQLFRSSRNKTSIQPTSFTTRVKKRYRQWTEERHRRRLLVNIMKLIYKRRFVKRILFGTGICLLLVFIFIFIIIPLVYKNSYSFQRSLLFLNFVNIPVNFKSPSSLGLDGARNFYLTTEDNVTLGVWQILPQLLLPKLKASEFSEKDYENALGDGTPVFIYMHGNSGNRGSAHRVELYKILQQNNYHVVAFDYRSYGDSSPVEPSESGVVSDSKAVYNWVKSHSNGAKIYFWGHSLGTGISSHLLDVLESEGRTISGLVLEAPFNNMCDEVRSYPLAKMFRYLPWFDFFFTEPMYENGLKFQSDRHLVKVKAPILILHAEDDLVIPIQLGLKLYETVQSSRQGKSPIKFIKFDKNLHFGHKFIYKDTGLSSTIKDFVKESSKYKPF
ncbi:lysophosphatidylserine lipase ABHD12 isoform X2 [Halyomorpha halys]|uniref:lysophosphatidylserine lipase ABHD12 isoform X2 n=1 Tax=Halyomorpha halys TaxID=286706 RepID=UPI0006D50FEB|nr:monoacylglycerol lipase ABHD12 isoform X2 [Halyomorpha halys]